MAKRSGNTVKVSISLDKHELELLTRRAKRVKNPERRFTVPVGTTLR